MGFILIKIQVGVSTASRQRDMLEMQGEAHQGAQSSSWLWVEGSWGHLGKCAMFTDVDVCFISSLSSRCFTSFL